MKKWLRRLGLMLALSWISCGDGVVIISFNSGVIVGPPHCQGSGGQFQMHTDGGLTLLVVITSTTQVIVAGSGGTCSDLFANAPVQVSGREKGDRIVASSITVD